MRFKEMVYDDFMREMAHLTRLDQLRDFVLVYALAGYAKSAGDDLMRAVKDTEKRIKATNSESENGQR